MAKASSDRGKIRIKPQLPKEVRPLETERSFRPIKSPTSNRMIVTIEPITKKEVPKRISYKDFALEILRDISTLQKEYSEGLYVTDLQEYYGESANRIMHALKHLEARGEGKLCTAVNRAYYFVPKNALDSIGIGTIELTELQRRVLSTIRMVCEGHGTTSLRTDYSQLSRVTSSSIGGLKLCIKRLSELGYIEIVEQSAVGQKAQMLIKLGQKLLAHHLPS